MKQTFTFGQAHRANDGTPLGNRYVIIEGEDSRDIMFRLFGPFWAFQYDTPEDAGKDKYGLTEYVIPDTQVYRHDVRGCDDNCTGRCVHAHIGGPCIPCDCACHHGGTGYDDIHGEDK